MLATHQVQRYATFKELLVISNLDCSKEKFALIENKLQSEFMKTKLYQKVISGEKENVEIKTH